MDEQMNNNGYQSQPNPMPNQNKDNYAVGIGTARIKHK